MSFQGTEILYDIESIDQVPWPETPNGHFAKTFLTPIVQEGVNKYVNNIDGKMYVLQVDDIILPVLVPTVNPENSYVVSPFHHYISFGKEHADVIKQPWLLTGVKAIFPLLEGVMQKCSLDSVVYVNHWLFSTDLYPKHLHGDQLKRIFAFLEGKFPDRAIIFRSLNEISTPELLKEASSLDCHLIPSRYVFLTQGKDSAIFETRIFKSDLRHFEKRTYDLMDGETLAEGDCASLLDLERRLYVEQHSKLQPHYSNDFMTHLFNNKLLKFKVLKNHDHYVGVAGFYECDGVMFCPFLGFDKNDPEHNQVFRLLNTVMLMETQEKQYLFHQSAGASFYKNVRRAEGAMEFLAVSTKHLKKKQKFAWSLLNKFINAFSDNIRNY